MDNLLLEFQAFWQANSEEWEKKSKYTEAFPHLLLMAFLQRVINGRCSRLLSDYLRPSSRSAKAALERTS
jgi:hypothetical protein